MKDQSSIRSASEAIKACLNEIPHTQLTLTDESLVDAGPDYVIHLETPFGRKTIYAEISVSGQPRFARPLVKRVGLHAEDASYYWVFVAPFISEKTGKMLRSAGIGFIDFAGNCFISFDGLHIQKEGKKNPHLKQRHFNSLFKIKASRVLRVLLTDPAKSWKITSLAKEARVSIGHVYNVKEELLNREWAVVDNKEIRLSEPAHLLKEWCSNYRFEGIERRSFYSLLNTAQLENKIEKVCRELKVRYALTGFAGAARLVPFARYHRIHCYVESRLDDLAKRLDLQSVTSGENIILMLPSDDGVLYGAQNINEECVASSIQLYLDLKALSDRGEEAADFIYEEVIDKQWGKEK